MGIARPDEAHKCLDCGEMRAHKPIAHKDALDDPIGHLCLMCYASWVQCTDYAEECVVCGEDVEYCTVREISDFDGEPVLTTGQLGGCEEHTLECVGVKVAPPKKIQ